MSGRVFGPKEKKRYLTLVGRGIEPRLAAEQIHFAWSTVKRHLDIDAEFRAAAGDQAELADARVVGVLHEMAMNRNLGAIQMWLFNKRPDQWRDMRTIRNEISGPNGGPIQMVSAVTLALREVITDVHTRPDALGFVRAIDIPTRDARALESHGHAVAPHGLSLGGITPAPERPEASEVPEREDL